MRLTQLRIEILGCVAFWLSICRDKEAHKSFLREDFGFITTYVYNNIIFNNSIT